MCSGHKYNFNGAVGITDPSGLLPVPRRTGFERGVYPIPRGEGFGGGIAGIPFAPPSMQRPDFSAALEAYLTTPTLRGYVGAYSAQELLKKLLARYDSVCPLSMDEKRVLIGIVNGTYEGVTALLQQRARIILTECLHLSWGEPPGR